MMHTELNISPDILWLFPAQKGDKPDQGRRPGDDQGLSADHRRILIVEDEFFIAAEMEAILSDAGYEVVGIASEEATALSLAEQAQPHLILMDIRLARGPDGVEIARQIYEKHAIRSIFVTAHTDARTQERGREANPHGWIAKPFTDTQLLSVIASTLKDVN